MGNRLSVNSTQQTLATAISTDNLEAVRDVSSPILPLPLRHSSLNTWWRPLEQTPHPGTNTDRPAHTHHSTMYGY